MIFENCILTINNPKTWIGFKNEQKWYDNIIRICIRPVWFILTVICLERSIYFLSLAFK